MSKISKYMSFILRHAPEKAGLQPDAGGWVPLDELFSNLKAEQLVTSIDELLAVVKNSDKKRFTISEDGTQIRAAQGHSTSIELGLKAMRPPDILFHGTASKNISSILEEGILPQKRQHVHLSTNEETAYNVGQRHGKPIVLKIDTKMMFNNDYKFWISDNDVWLTKYVPSQFISFSEAKSELFIQRVKNPLP